MKGVIFLFSVTNIITSRQVKTSTEVVYFGKWQLNFTCSVFTHCVGADV